MAGCYTRANDMAQSGSGARLRAIVGMVVLCLAANSCADILGAQRARTANAGHWVALLEARYRGVTTSEATFLERYTESGRLLRAEAGTAYFRRPGKMRWEYAAPEKNLFLVDGKTAWFYVPSDHTVTRVPAKRSSDWRTPLALLAGDMKLSRVCSRVQLANNEQPLDPKNVVLNCQLRGEPAAKPASRSRRMTKQRIATPRSSWKSLATQES